MKKFMRRAAVMVTAVAALVGFLPGTAHANAAVHPTAPVVYVGPYYGWYAWCALVGWNVYSQGSTMVVGLVLGSMTDDGSGQCANAPSVAEADMAGLIVVTDAAGHLVNYAVTTMGTDGHWKTGGNFLAFSPGYFLVNVTGRWTAHGSTVYVTLPPQLIYLY